MIKDNLLKIKERILSACLRGNQDPASITIVAVSKNRTVEEIREAIASGLSDIGENKVKEALKKYYELRDTSYELRKIKWHLIGHLQTNKVRTAIRIFDLIESVDSLRLALEINKEAEKINKVQDILMEVKTSPETTKYGFRPEDAVDAAKEISRLNNVSLKGLMTIAPLVDIPEKTRPYFRQLRELRERINESRVTSHELRILSMGMSDDFEVALEEGSTMVRIGRLIFEGVVCIRK